MGVDLLPINAKCAIPLGGDARSPEPAFVGSALTGITPKAIDFAVRQLDFYRCGTKAAVRLIRIHSTDWFRAFRSLIRSVTPETLITWRPGFNSNLVMLFGFATLLSGCSTIAPHLNPPLHVAGSDLEAYLDANEESMIEGGDVYKVRPTGSMEPTLTGGDYLVVVDVPFESLKVGQIITYRADWAPPPDPYVTHRIVAKDGHGLIMQGDNVAESEASWRVTDDEDKGLVVSIWRVKK